MINNNHININSSLFEDEIKKAIKQHDVKEIIETGTNTGVGSTTILAKMEIPVFTLECNPANAEQAKFNLVSSPHVTIVNGFSLKKKDMVNFILSDKTGHPQNIRVDALNPTDFYLKEINFDVPEDLLFPLIENDKNQLIFLDSAGGVGYLEYLKVMSLVKEQLSKKVLVLDDIHHVKHYRSVLDLEQKGYLVNKYDRFCIVKL
jgi:biopolymer transport protein ExbD